MERREIHETCEARVSHVSPAPKIIRKDPRERPAWLSQA